MFDGLDPDIARRVLLARQDAFTRYFWHARSGSKMLWNAHHQILCDTLDKVFFGKIRRLIVNIPPGYTKTEILKLFIARGLAFNPASQYIYASYNLNLALDASRGVRNIVTEVEQFRALFPNLAIRNDTSAKNLWRTVGHDGGLKAGVPKGDLTGFRAGRMDTLDFSGAMCIDDPLKPADARSAIERGKVNDAYNNVIRSRLAVDAITPVIIIMQRLHEDDLCGFLLEGGSDEMWHHLVLPATIEEGYEYPQRYKYGIPVEHDLPTGPLWAYKYDTEGLEKVKRSNQFTYFAQYQQDPKPQGDLLFEPSWWRYYKTSDPIKFDYLNIYADTAQKEKENSDYSVLQLWGAKDGNAYLVDQVRGKWNAPKLRDMFTRFVAKHHVPHEAKKVRAAKVEDKSSGTGLIQEVQNKLPVPVLPIKRTTDKVSRANDIVGFIEEGRVYLPGDASWLSDYVDEFDRFSPDMSHKHDDQVDPTIDAIGDICGNNAVSIGSWTK